MQPLLNYSRVDIIGTLINTHLVPDDHTPCQEPWAGVLVEFW